MTVLVFAVLAAHWRPLWYDELFTLYVASEPSFRATLAALLHGADTNPPVDYLLRHASLALLGSSAEALRLPSAAAFIAGLLATYAFVRRRAPFLAAAAAFLFPIGTAAAYFGQEARAYELLFASAPLALLAWQRAVDAPRPLRLVTLLAALCLGPYSHYFGVLNFVPVAAGEAWRSWQRRVVDWPIVATIAGACVLTLGLLPFARTAMSMQASFWASHFTLGDAFGYYRGFLESDGLAAFALAAVAAAISVALARGRARALPNPSIPSHEIVAAAVLAATPLTAFVLASIVTGALTSRYVIALVPGAAILFGYLLACVEMRLRAVAATAVAMLTACVLWQHVTTSLSHRRIEQAPATIEKALRTAALPIAFDSPHQFLEFDHYQSRELASRFVYPMDPATALHIRGFNNDEIALRNLSRIRPLNVTGYREFTSSNPEFLVVYRDDFAPGLVQALKQDGFCLVPVAREGQTLVLRAFPGCGR